MTRRGQPGEKLVDRITCLVCRRNVSYSRASLHSAIAHLKTHNIYSAEDATDSLLRLVYQYASSNEALPPQFYPMPVMATTATKDRARTHTLADFGMQPTASTGANTMLARRFKRAAAMWWQLRPSHTPSWTTPPSMICAVCWTPPSQRLGGRRSPVR